MYKMARKLPHAAPAPAKAAAQQRNQAHPCHMPLMPTRQPFLPLSGDNRVVPDAATSPMSRRRHSSTPSLLNTPPLYR